MAKPYVPHDGPTVTRADACSRGLKRFFTGAPCIHGHVSERQTTSGMCLTCARINVLAGYHRNPEPVLRRVRAYAKKNQVKRNAYNLLWHSRNPERQAVYAAKWESKRPGIRAIYTRRYRARLNSAEGTHTADDIVEILKAQKGRCAYCRKPLGRSYHVDHIKPLARGGSNDRSNLQCTCPKCNQSKNDHAPEVFARKIGLLI